MSLCMVSISPPGCWVSPVSELHLHCSWFMGALLSPGQLQVGMDDLLPPAWAPSAALGGTAGLADSSASRSSLPAAISSAFVEFAGMG